MTEETAPFPTYIQRAIPHSAQEALSRFSYSRQGTVAKSAIISYIRSWFDGPDKGLFNSVCKYSTEYTTMTLPKDSDQRSIMLARYWSGMGEHLPQILVADMIGRAHV